MKQFKHLDELNQTFVSMNHKVNLSEKEKELVFNEIKEKMNNIPMKPKTNPIHWKYFLATVAVALLLIVMVTPSFTNDGRELLGGNEQNSSNSSLDSSPISGTKKEYVVVTIVNNMDFDIPQLELNVYQNGHIKASQGSMNADGSPVEKGDYFEFTFTNEELAGESSLEAVIISPTPNQGSVLVSSEPISINVTEDKEYFFEIKGSPPSNVYMQNVDPNNISIESTKAKDTFDATIHNDENEMAAIVQEKLSLGLRKEQVESILGEDYYEEISNIDGREYWRYDIGNEDYRFPNDDGEMGDKKGLSNDLLQAQVFLYWSEEGKLNAFSVLYRNQKDGKVYLYYVLSDGSSDKSEVQVK